MQNNLSQHKLAKRACPVCKQVRSFPTRQATCSRACASRLATGKPEAPRDAETMIREHRLERDNHRIRSELAEALKAVEQNASLGGLLAGFLDRPMIEAPEWVRKAKRGSKQATPCTLASRR